jgi:hypothetical protein
MLGRDLPTTGLCWHYGDSKMCGNGEVGGGGLWIRWLEHTVQRALVHDFRGPGFPANSWYSSSPTPLSLQLVCPPLFGTKGGGATLACG